ncbi:MAG: NAD(+) synthase [PVC group bacterium]|nr:NAD(+) synthase [PVC group bacterium]
MDFNKDILKINCEKEADRISNFILEQVRERKKEGVIVGLSGGIDSALAAALSVRSLGKERVFGLILPERESNPISAEYAEKHAKELGIETETVDITRALEQIGAYEKRDEVIRSIFPEYNEQCRTKITLPPDLLEKDAFNFFTLNMDDGSGNVKTARLKKESLNGIVAATNMKHRTRMLTLYYYAEKKNYIVCGTTNKTETLEGDFVKYGDGGVDIEPLAHSYKSQGYQLAEYLGIIREIIERAPSPDTFSLPVSDQEFYFRMDFDKLDPLLYAWENKVDMSKVCEVMGLTEVQVKRAFRDFTSKYNTTKHLRHMPASLE